MSATTDHEGSKEVTEHCRNCGWGRTYTRTIPQVQASSGDSGAPEAPTGRVAAVAGEGVASTAGQPVVAEQEAITSDRIASFGSPSATTEIALRDAFATPRRLRIALPPDFDFDWVLGFLAARTVASLETVGERAYHRSVRVNGKPVTLTLTEVVRGSSVAAQRGQRVLVAGSRPRLTAAALEAAIRRMLDLDVDLERFHRLARRDPILARSFGGDPASGCRSCSILSRAARAILDSR